MDRQNIMFYKNQDKSYTITDFLMKCGEIWNKIAELMVIHNPDDFVEIDDYGDEFIMLEIEKNTTAVRDENKNDLAFVFTCVINNLLQTSRGQYRY